MINTELHIIGLSTTGFVVKEIAHQTQEWTTSNHSISSGQTIYSKPLILFQSLLTMTTRSMHHGIQKFRNSRIIMQKAMIFQQVFWFSDLPRSVRSKIRYPQHWPSTKPQSQAQSGVILLVAASPVNLTKVPSLGLVMSMTGRSQVSRSWGTFYLHCH